eukprot:EG_transcript_4720
MYATSRSPFPSFGKRDVDADEQPAPKLPFFGAPPAQPAKPPKKPSTNSDALESVGKITGVGAKVVSELALYLAFNTGYFITNTYQFLSKEEQKQLAKQTVDKQLPELLSLLGGTTEALGKTASTVAATEEYKELQKAASEAAQQLTKGVKSENTPTPEVIEKLKKIVADEKGEVLSEERKNALAETLKKGGVKGAELSLYLFYNVFTVLKNLDKVLPTEQQTTGIEGKINELETKLGDLAESVKDLPSASKTIVAKVEELKQSIPTPEDLANLDPAEVSLSVRSSLVSAKSSLEKVFDAISNALKEDSNFRRTLAEIGTKLRPVSDALGKLLARLPLPKKEDGTVDYSKLLADSGIITVKGIKALIEATKKAAGSVSSKTSTE